MSSDTEIRPFRVDTPDQAITGLRRHIAGTRWPTRELVADRSQGVQLATLQELARYWATDYDWRAYEAELNALPQFTIEIDGTDVHFSHVKSPHPAALPLTLYWLTGTGASAARSYWENTQAAVRAAGQPRPEVKLPVGFTTFPGEIWRTPRSWVEKSYPNVTYFHEASRGGHFAAWEEPELFATEIRAAFSSLR
jgi:pimeloyl-ACP methyl ester carboxylesterase